MRIFCLYCLLFVSSACWGQDPVLSQYFSNKPLLNPSLTGYEGGTLVNLNFRQERYTLGGQLVEFNTNNLSAELDLPCLQSALALMYIDRVEGEGYLRWQSLSTAYAWRSRARPDRQRRDWEWRFGMRLAYNWRSLNWDNLVFSEQLDAMRGILGPTNLPLPGDLRSNTDYFDLQAGYSWVYHKGDNRFRLGLTLNHLLRIEQSVTAADDTLPMRTTLHTSYVRSMNINGMQLDLMPFVRLDIQQGNAISFRQAFRYQALTYGMIVNTHSMPSLWGGVWLQSYQSFESQPTVHALVFQVGFEFPVGKSQHKSSVYRFGLSYDYPFAGLAAGGSNIFEVSLAVHFPQLDLGRCIRNKKRYIPAAKF
ncbi:MAG: PorP/SprF family type IX secretion system membrane protein [Bacteroidota bacterium]